jgi:hypothetical protein
MHDWYMAGHPLVTWAGLNIVKCSEHERTLRIVYVYMGIFCRRLRAIFACVKFVPSMELRLHAAISDSIHLELKHQASTCYPHIKCEV